MSNHDELFERAHTSHRAGDLDAAEHGYAEVIRLAPSNSRAHMLLGYVHYQRRNYSEAIPLLEQACRLCETFAVAHYTRGCAYRWAGRSELAIAAFDQALALDSAIHEARFARTMTHLPMVYATQPEIEGWRSRYGRSLAQLAEYYAAAPPDVRCAATRAIGDSQPYFLPYQAGDDRDLQESYGQLVCLLMATRYPQFADTPAMPDLGPRQRLRVGFLSAFFKEHSNWKMPIRGWLENVDRSRFHLCGYYVGDQFDEWTAAAQTTCDDFVHGLKTVEDWANRIRADALHALVIPGQCMDVMTGKLCALRLAPIQCNAVGHPVTAGMPTFDYYLSSDLMEPANGDAHYSETLVRLPNIGVHYLPTRHETSPLDRTAIGIRPDAVVYACCQSLYKYLPRYDELFPQIARSVPNAQFAFIRHHTEHLNRVFACRMEQSFAAFGLNWEEHVVVEPRLSTPDFNALLSHSDVFLDTPDWNGMNTVMEALAFDIPIVTLPGEFMRGRHAAAILQMIGVTETIANSLDSYIDLAVRLGKEPNWRRAIAEKIARHKAHAYGDTSCVLELQAFLESAVKERARRRNRS